MDLAALVRNFETAEQASQTGRMEAEQARDYYDGKQLSEAERKALRKRKQPEIVINRIKRKIDYLRGLERQGRTDPKAYARTEQHTQDAEAVTDALRYVSADQSIDIKRSYVFEHMLIEGFGGVEVTAQQTKGGIDPKISLIAWDRLFFDPHSCALDFSDARYLGFVTWMDADDAKARWPDKADIIDATMSKSTSTASETYDDKPRWSYWADTSRKRIRVVTMYYLGDGWQRCEFTLSGHLTDPAPSPFVDDEGKPECALILQAAYRDRDNDPYGIVRDMIGPQDEVNKRRSKALHLLSSRQVRVSGAAGMKAEEVKQELAKPDGVLIGEAGDVEILPTGDMTAGHFQLMQEAKNEIDLLGPNATMQGKSGQDQSGRAILALQQGGMVEMAPLMDGLRHFTIRLYRQVWNRIRQYWQEERWVRVTDDDRNVRFVALNTTQGALNLRKLDEALKAGQVDEATAQQYAQQIQMDPRSQEPANAVAELDVDIDIDEVNETPSLQIEQFEQLVGMAQAGMPIPPEVIIEASSLRNKDKLLKMLEEAKTAQAQPDPQQELMMRDAEAQVAKTEAEAALTGAKAQNEMIRPLTEGFRAGMQAQTEPHRAAA